MILRHRIAWIFLLVAWLPNVGSAQTTQPDFVNSIGLTMVAIPAGSFEMGSDAPAANFDEQPVHQVTISHAFYMSRTPVTAEAYRQFKPDAVLNDACAPWAAGMSWQDADAFCKWLSQKEGKSYRLPTEAEWEYACRAGESKATSRPADEPNPWGLRNMLGFSQWCGDWYGAYPIGDQTDPVGYTDGFARVVRGGPLDEASKYSKAADYLRFSSREGMPPNFGSPAGPVDPDHPFGLHEIGFRIVQSDGPSGRLLEYIPPYARQGVKQTQDVAQIGPDPAVPFFRKRRMLPIPPEDTKDDAIHHAGLDPSFRFHNHSPGMAVMPNGDVLLIIYTSHVEYEPQVSLIAARLRFGADEWDMPCPMIDTPGANDHAPLLFNDGGKVYLFWGNPYAIGHYPFQFMTSLDSGVEWSRVNYPHVVGPIGPLTRPQPINTLLHAADGTIYVPCDAPGAHSLLWASSDGGITWRDTGGRTDGRHTSFVLLKDGSILGMGGKSSNIDGYMPQVISRDAGKTYEISKTPFSALNGGQRPCVLRLKSGRILMAGDYQPSKGSTKPPEIKESGCYVALSDDEGKTWHFKTIPETQNGNHDVPTLGYCVARQAPNGQIHLITSLTHPALDFEFNEAWILSDAPTPDVGETTISGVQEYRENYSDGKPRIIWHAGIGSDGRYLLDGAESWFYPDGSKQREAEYHLGKLTGTETYLMPDGAKSWEWQHNSDGTAVWTTWWPNGAMRSQSTWIDKILVKGSDQFWPYPGK